MNKYLLLFVVLILFFMIILNKVDVIKNKKEHFNVNSGILSLNRLILRYNENSRPEGIEQLQTLDSIDI